ncbi:MAG: NlpC/P60 family protein [Verrucomicrobiales bacterium]|nr:NlpC/P60 family protein [Verrucomicrobiales bacterium]
MVISAVAFLSNGHAAPKERTFRSIRPIVPIKQNVNPGETRVHTQTVKLTIPPPPIPEPSSALFPEGSVPEIDLPPETVVETNEKEEEKSEGLQLPDPDAPSLARLREEAHRLADRGLTYKFGADDPKSGGLDCSGAMQYLLSKIGVDDVPRTSYDQYYWLKKQKLLDDVYGKSAADKMFKKLAPGDLIFWGGTWKSGHRVSHVMLYLGYDANADKHYVFGARGKSSKGLLGNGVDIFELEPDRGRLIAHGKIPGLVYQ